MDTSTGYCQAPVDSEAASTGTFPCNYTLHKLTNYYITRHILQFVTALLPYPQAPGSSSINFGNYQCSPPGDDIRTSAVLLRSLPIGGCDNTNVLVSYRNYTNMCCIFIGGCLRASLMCRRISQSSGVVRVATDRTLMAVTDEGTFWRILRPSSPLPLWQR